MKYRLILLVLAGLLVSPVLGEGLSKVPVGQKVSLEGVIVQKSADQFRVRTFDGNEMNVVWGPITKIEEKKTNPFRSAEKYGPEDFLLGLNVRVEGNGDTNGSVLADKIRFTQDELKVAQTITSRVSPVESRLDETQQQLLATQDELHKTTGELDQKTGQLSAQVEELNGAFKVARGEASKAQSTADQALSAAGQADEHASFANQRISKLDQYQELDAVVIPFGFNSSALTPDSKSKLDKLAGHFLNQDAYLIEVAGFASSDGDSAYNRRLSERRAEVVVDYLAENHDIPIRRIVRPFGFGEAKPVADNSTSSGRKQNRRVEVRVLQNVGISQAQPEVAVNTTKSQTSSSGIR
ncbi:MAG: OmpA family protein [Acidobacteriota bacterium]